MHACNTFQCAQQQRRISPILNAHFDKSAHSHRNAFRQNKMCTEREKKTYRKIASKFVRNLTCYLATLYAHLKDKNCVIYIFNKISLSFAFGRSVVTVCCGQCSRLHLLHHCQPASPSPHQMYSCKWRNKCIHSTHTRQTEYQKRRKRIFINY